MIQAIAQGTEFSIGVNIEPDTLDNQIQHSNIYSTDEIPCGVWTDGQTLYKKTFNRVQEFTINNNSQSTLIQVSFNSPIYPKKFEGYFRKWGNQTIYNTIYPINMFNLGAYDSIEFSSFASYYAPSKSLSAYFANSTGGTAYFSEVSLTVYYTKNS